MNSRPTQVNRGLPRSLLHHPLPRPFKEPFTFTEHCLLFLFQVEISVTRFLSGLMFSKGLAALVYLRGFRDLILPVGLSLPFNLLRTPPETGS